MPMPYEGERFTFSNPDGTSVDVRGWGNQHFAVFETLDGFTVVKDPDTGIFNYARLPTESGSLEATGAKVGSVDPASLGLTQHLRPDRVRAQEIASQNRDATGGRRRWEIRRAEKNRLRMASPLATTVTGSFTGLCVLVEFPDVAATIPRADVENFCNKVGYSQFGNNGSVRDYFRDVSDGKLTYTNIVTQYHTAANDRDHYADSSVTWPRRARELAIEVLDGLVAADFDFSDLSVDSGGHVYAFNLFYAGGRVNFWAEGLWPGSSSLTTTYDAGDGRTFSDLQWTNMGDELSLGTFCHENGHMLCDFPDLYDYGAESNGAGKFSLMSSSGSKNPVQVDAYLKAEAGWATRLAVIKPGRIQAVSSGLNDFYIFSKNAQEYFIVENRQQTGRDANLPGSGLAIWHVDETGSNSNEQMTSSLHYECSIEQADGKFDLEHNANAGDADDLFGAPGATRFTDATTPDGRWWDGSASGLVINPISRSGPTMTFGGPWSKRSDDTPAWSDASGWSEERYYSTMRLAVAGDNLYLLARGGAGVDLWCYDTAQSTWSKRSDDTPAWSDASGWSEERYYSTMRLAVAGDNLYLLARGGAGVDLWCYDTAQSTWSKRSDDTPAWSDASDWSEERYYSTMRLAVAGDNLYLLARGGAGVDLWCYDTAQSTWSKRSDDTPAWSDASDWSEERYYSTMRLAVAGDNLYLLARGGAGVDLWCYDTAQSTWSKRSDDTPAWSDASDWSEERYYSTMRLAVAGDNLYLLARGGAGVDLWCYDTAQSTWSKRSDDTPAWSDASGWSEERYYSTMRLAVAGDNLYLLARGGAGVDLWCYDTAQSTWSKRSDDTPAWSDASGWSEERYYSTMRLAVAGDNLYLLARGGAGVDLWRAGIATPS